MELLDTWGSALDALACITAIETSAKRDPCGAWAVAATPKRTAVVGGLYDHQLVAATMSVTAGIAALQVALPRQGRGLDQHDEARGCMTSMGSTGPILTWLMNCSEE